MKTTKPVSSAYAYLKESADALYETFEALHATPEPPMEEYRTSAYLARALRQSGFTVRDGFAQTALLGTWDSGSPGPYIVLRGDMDALCHHVDGAARYIHSCGHDANCTETLWAAKTVLAMGGLPRGKLGVLFQPAEETFTGAAAVVDSGILAGVTHMLGVHLRPKEELPGGMISPAILHSAAGHMTMRLYGRAAHGARPHKGANAIQAAAAVIAAVNGLPVDPSIPHSVKPTQIHSGSNPRNMIPDYTELVFDLRAQTGELMEAQRHAVADIAATAALAHGVRVETAWQLGAPAATPSPRLIALAQEVIIATLGKDALAPPMHSPGGEDFHRYEQMLPGLEATMLGIGAELVPGLHMAQMQFDPRAMVGAAAVLAALCMAIAQRDGE